MFFYNGAHFNFSVFLSEKSLKKANLLNPRGVAVDNVQDKIQFSNARPWGTVEDDHKPFMEHRWGKTLTADHVSLLIGSN